MLTGIQGSKQQVELLFDIGADVPRYLIADKLRLQQILINLTSNALKFTEQGFVKLSIQLLASAGEQVRLAVRVEDTGIGIAPEHQQKYLMVSPKRRPPPPAVLAARAWAWLFASACSP